jgi:hypothetical protein
MEFSLSNPIVALEKLWFLQRLHARQRILEGGQGYDELVSWTLESVQRKISEDQLRDLGLESRDALLKRINLLLQSTRDWTTADEFVESYECFFGERYGEPGSFNCNEFRSRIPQLESAKWFNELAAEFFGNALERAGSEISVESARAVFDDCVAKIDEEQQNLPNSYATALDSTKAVGKALHALVRLWLARGANTPSTFDSLHILGPNIAARRIRDNSVELHTFM